MAYLGSLAHKVGWKFQAVTATLEGKGKERAKIHYWKKRQLVKMGKQAKKKVEKKMTDTQRSSRQWSSGLSPTKLLIPKTTTTKHQANEHV